MFYTLTKIKKNGNSRKMDIRMYESENALEMAFLENKAKYKLEENFSYATKPNFFKSATGECKHGKKIHIQYSATDDFLTIPTQALAEAAKYMR